MTIMANRVIPDNCQYCLLLTRDEEGFGFYHCTHPLGSLVRVSEGRNAGNPPMAVRPVHGFTCPLLTDPVLLSGGAHSWPPDPPEPPVDFEEELNKIGKCPHCGKKI